MSVLAELRTLEAAATVGWREIDMEHGTFPPLPGTVVARMYDTMISTDPDAAHTRESVNGSLIVAMRNALLALLDVAEDAQRHHFRCWRAENHKRAYWPATDGDRCWHAGRVVPFRECRTLELLATLELAAAPQDVAVPEGSER